MPLMERGGPQVDEEAKESKEAAQLLEAAPVATEPQISWMALLGMPRRFPLWIPPQKTL